MSTLELVWHIDDGTDDVATVLSELAKSAAATTFGQLDGLYSRLTTLWEMTKGIDVSHPGNLANGLRLRRAIATQARRIDALRDSLIAHGVRALSTPPNQC